MKHRKVYVASSWRNPLQPGIVSLLRRDHQVYDFREPSEGEHGFSWSEIDPAWLGWASDEYLEALKHPVAEHGFKLDFDAMKWADACVLVLPCGRSAHLEAGWLSGQGKTTVILLDDLRTPSPGHTFIGHCEACGEIEVRAGSIAYRCREHHRRATSREPELMYKIADLVTADPFEVSAFLGARS